MSKWLFAGQILASIGFIIYSAMIGSVVLVVTNTCILITAIVGQVITARKRRSGYGFGTALLRKSQSDNERIASQSR